MIRLQLPAIALALIVSWGARADLRTYDVDPQYRDEILSALSDILTPDPSRGLIMEAHGRVELLPSGQILVNASAETLDQVQRVMQAITERSVPAAPSARLRYWAIFGTSAAVDATNEFGLPPPPALNDVLAELGRFHGDLIFRVIGAASLTTSSGQPGEVEGMTLSVDQTAHIQGDSLNAQISLELFNNSMRPPMPQGRFDIGHLEVRTTLNRGDFVVLGESHLRIANLDGPVFYIVHWAGE